MSADDNSYLLLADAHIAELAAENADLRALILRLYWGTTMDMDDVEEALSAAQWATMTAILDGIYS